jgi:hypothetical protein
MPETVHSEVALSFAVITPFRRAQQGNVGFAKPGM